jgi:EAL domain-containing protein (putative c-di-GMP-specific phosphodiesterase class I)
MAQRLGHRVIAEGVETADQLTFLRGLGCQEIQGYLFSPPVPAEKLEAMVRDGRTLQVG